MELFTVSDFEILARLTIAALLGIMIGTERSRVGKRAGMRTYALVALGASLFIVISGVVATHFTKITNFDPLRVASQIVVGIGFLGAGVIFVQRNELTGLTTAAGLWVAAAIGAACGYGLYTIAAYVTFLTLFIFEAMWYIEERFIKIAQTDTEECAIARPKKSAQHNEYEG